MTSPVDIYIAPVPLGELEFRVEGDQLEILDAEERQRYQRYRHQGQKNTFLASRIMMKTELAKRLGLDARDIVFDRSENGKPHLKNSDLHFSLSHCHHCIAFAVGSENMGIDVEDTARCESLSKNPKQFFSDTISQKITHDNDGNIRCPNDAMRYFAQYWTCMESAVKYMDASLFSFRHGFDLGLSKGVYTSGTLSEYFASYLLGGPLLPSSHVLSVILPKHNEIRFWNWIEASQVIPYQPLKLLAKC